MSRPRKHRVVTCQPTATVYKPAGVRARDLEWTNLTLDEFEAVRLVDGEGLNQEAVGERMGVSRPTVTRILAAARLKIARVLVNGQALLIEGGPVVHGEPGRRSARRPSGACRRERATSPMVIAVTARGPDLSSAVDPRFGRAKYLIVVNIGTGEFKAYDNAGSGDAGLGAGTRAGQRVIELGVEALVTGRVGPRAWAALRAGDVAIFTGAAGSVQEIVEQFKAGRFEPADDANQAGEHTRER
jgi:predicted DNA-binding protein (UPF0251 family)/predicted Fe-Mo cluster-binding NifX family protein